ncbi:MAG: helix-turn-helix domain-containing protein [Megasphaera sp.]|uniref:helix-turn-helix domain-containing protein n=1 Tax=Megasphaera sp. TaxID=2023260 RepID=UPI003F0F30D2
MMINNQIKRFLKILNYLLSISSLLRFPLVYERSFMTYLNIDVDDFTSTPSHKWDTRLTFSPKEVSEMLGVPLSTIYALCYNESLKAFKIGTHWRIHRKGLYEFLRHSIDTSITL